MLWVNRIKAIGEGQSNYEKNLQVEIDDYLDEKPFIIKDGVLIAQAISTTTISATLSSTSQVTATSTVLVTMTSSAPTTTEQDSTDSTPAPTPEKNRPSSPIYPTDIDLDLILFCLNNNTESSCVDFFRFVHFFFSARLSSDPTLAAYLVNLGLDPPDTDIVTNTQTTSVRKILYETKSFILKCLLLDSSLLPISRPPQSVQKLSPPSVKHPPFTLIL